MKVIHSILVFSLINIGCKQNTSSQINDKNHHYEIQGFQKDENHKEVLLKPEYWISKNSKWKTAYDDVKYKVSPIIKKNENSSWKIIFPGSLTLINDTIRVNQELGFKNRYFKIEKLNIGDELKIAKSDYYIKYLNKDTIEFNNETFVRVSKTVINGFDS